MNDKHYDKEPLIGIVAKPLLKHQLTRTLWNRLVINDEFRQLIVNNGGIASAIIPKHFFWNSDTSNNIEILDDSEKEALLRQLQNLDGVILQGGLTSDTYEVEIVKYAIEKKLPLIGVCAGFNNIARALDIPLFTDENHKNIHNVYDKEYRHKIYINQKSELCELFEDSAIEVNSLHTMFVNKSDMPVNTEIIALDSDNHVEAFTVKNTKLCMAIKWHPEIMLDDATTKNIFKYFIQKCSVSYK